MLRSCRSSSLLILGLLLILPLRPAAAQSVGELRNENAALRTRIGDLGAELEAARKENARLQELVADLMRQLDARAASGPAPLPPLPPEETTIDETAPASSPRALLRTLQERYAATFADRDPGAFGSRERSSYLRDLQRWASQQERDLRDAVTWTARIQRDAMLNPVPRGYTLDLVAVDPVTDVPLGDSFAALMSRAFARSLGAREDQIDLGGLFDLRGVVVPRVLISEERLEVGPFDQPRFIGPFAEFALGVEVQSLQPRPAAPAAGSTPPPPPAGSTAP